MLVKISKQKSGFIPTDFDDEKEVVIWHDVGDCQFEHPFFELSLESLKENNKLGGNIETEISVLEEDDLIHDSVLPTGFVFHMSRCGLTLLSKALAQSENNLVVSEASSINEILYFLYKNSSGNFFSDYKKKVIIKIFILAIGRKRGLNHQNFFIKFSSWNVLFIDLIQSIFPSVPCLFLYRSPVEVIVSLIRQPAGFSKNSTDEFSEFISGRTIDALKNISALDYIADCLINMLAHSISNKNTFYLNYMNFKIDIFPTILKYFKIETIRSEYAKMIKQFSIYSKYFNGTKIYVDDSETKREGECDVIKDIVRKFLNQQIEKLDIALRNLNNKYTS